MPFLKVYATFISVAHDAGSAARGDLSMQRESGTTENQSLRLIRDMDHTINRSILRCLLGKKPIKNVPLLSVVFNFVPLPSNAAYRLGIVRFFEKFDVRA